MGKNKSRNRSQERESSNSLTSHVVRQSQPRVSFVLSEIQDLRRVADPYKVALDLAGQVASIGVADRPQKQKTRSRGLVGKLRFDAPQSTLVCIRRHTRKEVLFAKKKTGRGGKSKKHFNMFSKVRCK